MRKILSSTLSRRQRHWKAVGVCVAVTLIATALSVAAFAQDQQEQDDPPGRVARLGYMEGSVSFQPAGENDWVQAAPNRPMTTGDKLWTDRDSRAEVQLGSSMIDLSSNTGFSFLNLDDHNVQMEVTAGSINIRVWRLDRDTNIEIDTPNQAFTIMEPGRYRLQTSENGDSTVVTVRDGSGESSGNGQSFTLHQGQRATFRGTTSLNADVEQIGPPDDFDSWSDRREHRYNDSPSAHYCSRQVVGFEDLDDNGDWQQNPQYGNVWYPHVEPGWAPYHNGHWAWIDPWGWTWVDDAPWGYAPFHYGRWVNSYGRWGWVPGPVEARPVYAPALVVFVGGHPGGGGDVAWFPLGPREVYVPAYRTSPGYVNQVNVSNTTVNQTTVTNVYNTTVVNNNTTVNNVTYVNRNVNGAVTAMPQHAFASAQPVARNAVQVNPRQFQNGPVMTRAEVPPSSQAVLGPHANSGSRVAAPPAAIANRQIIARTAPPPPPPAFAARQQMLAEHPGQPIPRQQLARMAPAPSAAAAPSRVHVLTPTRPTTPPPAANQPGNRPGATPASNNSGRPGQPQPGNERPGNQPGNRPSEPPARNDRPMPPANNRPVPGQPAANQPAPNRPDAPESNRPFQPPTNDRPSAAQPNNRPDMNQPAPNNRPAGNPEGNRPFEPPARNDRPNAAPSNAPQPAPARPQPSAPQPSRPEMNRPEPRNQPAPQPRNEPAPRPQGPPQGGRPQQQAAPPAQNHPAAPPQQQHESNKPDKHDRPPQ